MARRGPHPAGGCLGAAGVSKSSIFFSSLTRAPWCNATAPYKEFHPTTDGLQRPFPCNLWAQRICWRQAFTPPLPERLGAERAAEIKLLLPRPGERCCPLWGNVGLEAARPTSVKFKEQRAFRRRRSRETCKAIPFSYDLSACTIIIKLYLIECFLCPAQLIMF